MWASSVWGLFGLAATFGSAMLLLTPEQEWLRPYLAWATAICGMSSVSVLCWPLQEASNRAKLRDAFRHPRKWIKKAVEPSQLIAAGFVIILGGVLIASVGLWRQSRQPQFTVTQRDIDVLTGPLRDQIDSLKRQLANAQKDNDAVAATNPYPQSILTTRYYSKKNKEDVADILDKTADGLNKKGNDLFQMAETAINKSPWDRPGEDLAPMIDRLSNIEAVATDFRRDLFEVLYRDYPDYRIELNNLLFPPGPIANFQVGAKDFHNALVVWSEHRNGLGESERQQFVDLVNTARFAFGRYREEFLNWANERQAKIAQTRTALQK
jgi:hypothetical protein